MFVRMRRPKVASSFGSIRAYSHRSNRENTLRSKGVNGLAMFDEYAISDLVPDFSKPVRVFGSFLSLPPQVSHCFLMDSIYIYIYIYISTSTAVCTPIHSSKSSNSLTQNTCLWQSTKLELFGSCRLI